jgi:hypothetical protein
MTKGKPLKTYDSLAQAQAEIAGRLSACCHKPLKIELHPYDSLWASSRINFGPGESLMLVVCPRNTGWRGTLEAIKDWHTGYLLYRKHDLDLLGKIKT